MKRELLLVQHKLLHRPVREIPLNLSRSYNLVPPSSWSYTVDTFQSPPPMRTNRKVTVPWSISCPWDADGCGEAGLISNPSHLPTYLPMIPSSFKIYLGHTGVVTYPLFPLELAIESNGEKAARETRNEKPSPRRRRADGLDINESENPRL